MSELRIITQGSTIQNETNADSRFKINFTYLHQESCIRYISIQGNDINKILYLALKYRIKHFCYFLLYSYELSLPFKVTEWWQTIRIQWQNSFILVCTKNIVMKVE